MDRMALIPSMFVRRLVLIGAAVGLAIAAPMVRLGQLTLGRGEALAREADKKLVSETWLPTSRGRILDRQGRVLAMDRPSYDVAVEYDVLTGEWPRAAALRRARTVYRQRWGELTTAERAELAEQFRPAFEQAVDAMWARLAGATGMTLPSVLARRDEIVGEVRAAIALVDEQRRKREAELQRGRDLGSEVDSEEGAATPEPAAPAAPAVRSKRSRLKEETIAHVVLPNISDALAFELSVLCKPREMTAREADEAAIEGRILPGVSVVDGRNREYPLETMTVSIDRRSFPLPLRSDQPLEVEVRGVATHLLGWMRGRIYKEDIERRPREKVNPDGTRTVDRGHYQPGDAVGAAGLEWLCEDELRGLRGIQRTRLDTGERDRDDKPTPGADVRLTIDAALQARIQALFEPQVGLAIVQPWHKNQVLPSGTTLTGAAVVIDVDSGDVLAMVTAPSFTREQLRRDPDSVLGAGIEMPRLNRAISKPYQPGSIVKPLMLCAATTAGVYRLDERIACTGHFLPNDPTILRCWIYKQFGGTTHSAQLGHDLDGADALMVSCNIFFFELGKRLGPAGVVKWFERFSVGPASRFWDLSTYVRPRGYVAEPENENERSVWQLGGPKGPSASEAVQMAIGQGPIAWTPMQAANAYATIARGGVAIRPRLRLDSGAADAGRPENLGISPGAIEMALRGLRAGVEQERGTAHHVTYETTGPGGETKSVREPVFTVIERGKLAVWAKTGTADASAVIARNAEGQVEARDGDHSWTLALVGEKAGGRPRYAVAVVVDFAGSGGRVAGPLANQAIEALVAEGYLKE
jgi:penicillin-binding protein 2